MEAVLAVSAVVSALAALGALWFAYQTVHETRALRREDRIARLPELIAELGEHGIRHGATTEYQIRRAHVVTMLTQLRDDLPACRTLTESQAFDHTKDLRERQRQEQLKQATLDALAELAVVMHAER